MGQLPHPTPRKPPGAGRTIYDLLRTQIADGTLPAGARAPSTRNLAAELGVSHTTVTAAFEQLAAEGYLLTSGGRAARVAKPLVAPAPSGLPALAHTEPARFDFLYGAVASRDFPTLAWCKAYQAELLQQQQRLYYVPLKVMRHCAMKCKGICGEPGGLPVMPSRFWWCTARNRPLTCVLGCCFEATGARCLPVRLAYVTPSHQFPPGGVLPITRRHDLLHWARQHNAWVVEDDYDGEFRYGQRPIDALQSMDNDGRVIYVGTFSKTSSPQLRLGYLVLPQQLVPVFRQAKWGWAFTRCQRCTPARHPVRKFALPGSFWVMPA